MAIRNYVVRTSKKGLNLREKPSMESRVLRLIPNGKEVKIDSTIDTPIGWAAVNGGGYVMAEFLEAVTEPTEDSAFGEAESAPKRRGRRRKEE